jgi:hypothetical protein
VYVEDGFANGQIFLAEVHELGEMPSRAPVAHWPGGPRSARPLRGCVPGFEMAEVKLFDTIPDKMRFPQILPVLFEKVRDMV